MSSPIEDENVQESLPSLHNVNKFPTLGGFFPVLPIKHLTKISYESSYQPYSHSPSPPVSSSRAHYHLNPMANTLTPNSKENMESVRRSLIESVSVTDITPNALEDPTDKANLDNSAFGILHKNTSATRPKKTTTFGKVNTQKSIITSLKEDSEIRWNFECSNERLKALLEKIINNNYTMTFVSLLTVYCLFGDDVRTAFVDKSYDFVFTIISIICIFFFGLEIAASIVVKPNYYLSFFFWLDLVSAVSILLDLVWIQNLIFMGGQSSNIARASRFSKVGAKAGKVIRLVRLFRIVKLYKTIFEKQREHELKQMIEIRKNSIFAQDIKIGDSTASKDKRKSVAQKRETIQTSILDKHQSIFHASNSDKWYLSPTLKEIYKRTSQNGDIPQFHALSSKAYQDPLVESFSPSPGERERPGGGGEEETEETSESRVGQKLTDLTIKRVLVLVFILIFCVPLFSSNYWFDPTLSYDIGLKIIHNYTETSRNFTPGFNDSIDQNLNSLCVSFINLNTLDTVGDKVTYPLILLSTPINNSNCSYQSLDYINGNLRDEEKDLVQIDAYVAAINRKTFSVNNSIISIARTFYVCFLLGVFALFFSQDAQCLVLQPIERMIVKVNNIAKNPLASKYQQIIENKSRKNQEIMETTFIENAIVKIGTLLALGLGDAGAEIITSNIARMGDLVCITPGAKRFGVFGFCDIRNFTDATEVLQEDVMIFVNNIAEIVHTIVDRFQGSANKNIGDAFLLVWKFRVEDYHYIDHKLSQIFKDPTEIRLVKQEDTTPNPESIVSCSNLCDLSLMSFLKILCKLNRKEKILKYRENPGLNARLTHYKVKMGFGLHLGWAIEGSIGSDFKIDASYLSPNVNLASRLEAATKQYGIPLLFSHTLFEFLSEDMKKTSRKIDVVTVKGSQRPLGLYTVDLDFSKLPFKQESSKTPLEIREINALKKMAVGLGLANGTFKFEELFMYDKDLMFAYENLNNDFRQCFQFGVDCYLRGEWKQAAELLEKALYYKEDDGPCRTLITFMERFQFEKGEDWRGYRELVEK